MELNKCLCCEKYGNIKETSDNNNKILMQFFNDIEGTETLNPRQFYLDWLKGKNSILEKMSRSLVNDYSLEIRNGIRTKELFLSSFLSFKTLDYIEQMCGYKVDFKRRYLLNYDFEAYRDLSFVTIAMLINKYNPATLYKEHIIFICIKVAMIYFTLYKNEHFLTELTDIRTVTNMMLSTHIEVFNEFASKYGFKYTERVITKNKTLTKEQIDEFVKPTDTQYDIKRKIMRWCPCGERKARQIMRQYGLTKSIYVRKDYRQSDNVSQS